MAGPIQQILQLNFSDLTVAQVYAILKLRQQVFMLEQQSLYPDIDDLDADAVHFCIYIADVLTGYARLRYLPDKRMHKLERVLVSAEYRGAGLAAALMQKVLLHIQSTSNNAVGILLSAQLKVVSFYQKWGFIECGESYDDGGIEHIDMFKGL